MQGDVPEKPATRRGRKTAAEDGETAPVVRRGAKKAGAEDGKPAPKRTTKKAADAAAPTPAEAEPVAQKPAGRRKAAAESAPVAEPAPTAKPAARSRSKAAAASEAPAAVESAMYPRALGPAGGAAPPRTRRAKAADPAEAPPARQVPEPTRTRGRRSAEPEAASPGPKADAAPPPEAAVPADRPTRGRRSRRDADGGLPAATSSRAAVPEGDAAPPAGAEPSTPLFQPAGAAQGEGVIRDRWGRGRRGRPRGRGRFADAAPAGDREAIAPEAGEAGPAGDEAGLQAAERERRRRRRGGRRRGRGRLAGEAQPQPGEAGAAAAAGEAEGEPSEGGYPAGDAAGEVDAYGRRGRRHRRRGRRRGQPQDLSPEELAALEARRAAEAAAKEERRRVAEQQRAEAQRRKAEREAARRAQQQAAQAKRESSRRPKRGAAFGETWWSARWTAVLETFGWAARVARGAEYARQGAVRDLYMDEYGVVTAHVQGSRPEPYTVELSMVHITEEQWDAVLHEMSQNALLAAQLLAGDMPQDIEEVFFNVGVTLFPYDGQEIYADCDCPDQVNPCKHIAAVFYSLAQEFDRDPFLIFRFRGRTGEQVAAHLRALRAEAGLEDLEEVSPQEPEIRPLAECVDNFWKSGEGLETLRLQIAPPVTPGAVLLRLGQPNGWDGGRGFIFTMAPYYQALSERALQAAFAESGEARGATAPAAPEPEHAAAGPSEAPEVS